MGSAGVLTFSVIDGAKPVDTRTFAEDPGRSLPPLPTAGLPAEDLPEELLLDVTPQTAREINASRPFLTGSIPPAPPFVSHLEGDDRDRAIACLAAAAIYEAGGNSGDQSAVMQVVLNRVRHPAFPSGICAVVFQGSERRTGCQFSFTCDGSMRRRQYSAATVQSAKGLAQAMLDGFVDERVGLATHYHTDWVVPYWSASLEKLVAVRTHLFFRWQGYWGTRRAFNNRPAASEPVVPGLAGIFRAHAGVIEAELADQAAAEPIETAGIGAGLAPSASAPPTPARRSSARRLSLAAGTSPGRWALDAVELCSGQANCQVAGWTEPSSEPAALDRTSIAQSPPDLVFIKRSRDRVEQIYWNCQLWRRVSTSQCLGSAASTAELLLAD